jgi:long-subunit fatty acid transport protein
MRVCGVAVALLLLFPADARATVGLYFDATSARSAGMAGATIASGDDGLAQTENPASLVAAPTSLEGDVTFLHANIHFQNQGVYDFGLPEAGQPFANHANNAQDFANFPFPDNNVIAPQAALVLHFDGSDFHAGPFRLRNLVAGLAYQSVGGDGVRFSLDHPVLGPDARYRANQVVALAGASLAYRVTDWLSLGATFQGVGSRFRVDQPTAFDPLDFAKGTNPFLRAFGATSFGQLFGQLGLSEAWAQTKFSNDGVDWGLGGRFGATVRLRPWLILGLDYQTPRHLTYRGRAELDFTQQVADLNARVVENPTNSPQVARIQQVVRFLTGSLTPESVQQAFTFLGVDPSAGFVQHYDASNVLRLPQQIGVGLAARPSPRWLVEFDYRWIDWSAAFQTFTIRFRDGTNPNINLLAGSPNVDYSLLFGWHNQHVVSIGTAWEATPRLTLRLGYSYATEPIRAKGHLETLPAGGFHTLAAGATFHLTPRVTVSAALERAFPQSIHVHSSDISSFEAYSDESTNEYTAHLQLSIALGGGDPPPPSAATSRARR